MFRQCVRNPVMELNRKGLCHQECAILLDFFIKSFVALVSSTINPTDFRRKVSKRDIRIQERMTRI